MEKSISNAFILANLVSLVCDKMLQGNDESLSVDPILFKDRILSLLVEKLSMQNHLVFMSTLLGLTTRSVLSWQQGAKKDHQCAQNTITKRERKSRWSH